MGSQRGISYKHSGFVCYRTVAVNVSDYDFELPDSLIAQYPVSQRDHSRLMVLRRSDKSIEHRSFRELPELLGANDLLVTNNTKVLKARLRAYKPHRW